jgi:hypothetical protein
MKISLNAGHVAVSPQLAARFHLRAEKKSYTGEGLAGLLIPLAARGLSGDRNVTQQLW